MDSSSPVRVITGGRESSVQEISHLSVSKAISIKSALVKRRPLKPTEVHLRKRILDPKTKQVRLVVVKPLKIIEGTPIKNSRKNRH